METSPANLLGLVDFHLFPLEGREGSAGDDGGGGEMTHHLGHWGCAVRTEGLVGGGGHGSFLFPFSDFCSIYAFCFFQRGKENGLAVFSGYIRALARQKNTEWKRKSL